MTRDSPNRRPRPDRVARVLVWVFLAQIVWRLATMVPLYHFGWWTPVVHLGTLTVLIFLGALAWKSGRARRAVKVAIAIVAGLLWPLLTMYDANNLVYARFGVEPVSLGNLTIFYCASKSPLACLAQYPSVVLFAVGPLVLVALALAALIHSKLDVFAALASGAGQRLPTVVRRNARTMLFAVCAIYFLTWATAPRFMLAREPAASMIYVPPFEHGPRGLVDLPRPAYRIALTAGVVPRPLVLITVDSLRSDAIGLDPAKPSLTPFLRSLAVSGKLHDFGPAVAACSSSFCGISAIQSSGSWATLQNGPPLVLSDLLSANGFQTHFLLTGLHETTANLREIYGPNVSTFLSDNSPGSSMRLDDREQIRRLKDLDIADPDRTFLAIHLMSAHFAGARFDTQRDPREKPAPTPAKLSNYRSHYEGGVRQTDRIVKEVFAVLAAKGLLDRAIVIVTGDHGERFGVTGHHTHGGDIDRWTAALPLLVYDGMAQKWPPQPLVSQADAAATLIDAVGIDRPASWLGQSLKRPTSRRTVPTDSRHVAGMVALVDGRRLLFRCRVETGKTTVEAFDGTPLSGAKRQRALRAAPVLYAPLPKRNDAKRCFR